MPHDADNPDTRARDRILLADLWMRSMPAVASFIASIVRKSHDADDILQEVAMVAARDFDDYDRSRPFAPWVTGIARNRVLAHLRRSQRDGAVFNADLVAQLADASVEVSDRFDEMFAALDDCLSELPERSREAVHARYAQGASLEVVASQFHINNSAAAALLYRARRILLKCIQERTAADQGGAS